MAGANMAGVRLGGDRKHAHASGRRKERQQRKDETLLRSELQLDQFGVGAFRKESNRLMTLYSHGKQKDEEAETPRKGQPAATRSRMVNLAKIMNVVEKMPWERRADEVELVQREITKLEIHRTLRVSADAEFDLCKILMLRSIEPKEFLFQEGEIGDSFFIIVEGILEKGTKENGKDVEMLAPQTFGQESLIEEAHVNDIFVRCVQPTKMLEIKKAHFERYVRPLQLAEWERVATIVSELPIFNESDAVWEGNRLKRLLQSMQLKTYKAGDIILQEGVFQKHVIFLLSGHCHVTKHVQDEKFAKNAALLPSPLRSNTSMAMAQKSLNKQGARDVDIIVLYRGAVLDAEAPLEMRSASFTATAMSRVEVALIDTDASIFIDNPVIDVDTIGKLKKLGRCLPTHYELQAKCRMDSSWGFFRNHLFCHIIYRKRKEKLESGGAARDRNGAKRDDLIPDVPLDNPPSFNWNRV